MIIFKPNDLLDMSEGARGVSLARLLFGKRTEGVGGNSALYKWLDRVTKKQPANLEKANKKLIDLLSAKTGLEPRLFEAAGLDMQSSPLHVPPWFSFLRGLDIVAGQSFAEQLPRTAHLVLKLDLLSRIAENWKDKGDIEALSQLVRELPLSSTRVPDWVCEQLASGNVHNYQQLFFPLRVVTGFAMLAYWGKEGINNPDLHPVHVSPIFLARDSKTGKPSPFEPCFNYLLKLSSEQTWEALFKNLFDGDPDTRIRDGHRYKSGYSKYPGRRACMSFLQKAKAHYKLDPDAERELAMMFFVARLVARIYENCEDLSGKFDSFDPLATMDEFGLEWLPDEAKDDDILRQLDKIMPDYDSGLS